MQNEQLVDIIRIMNTTGIGPVSFYDRLRKFGSVQAVVHDLAQNKDVPSADWAKSEIKKAEDFGACLITYQDENYPETLKQLNDAPPVLYAKGHTELLQYPVCVAIVGARNASIAGRKMASRIAYDLTNSDVLVISGMARGIDAAAHKGALYAQGQNGPTIAVLGTGVDEIYPQENKDVYTDICRSGLILSEFPMGTTAQISHFPRRNRIISVLAQATLIVEAGLHSGSLITARLALEQGKEIFAVPGSPLDSRSAGPNKLIKEGAILTENAEDIIQALKFSQHHRIKKLTLDLLPLDKAENNVNISQQQKQKICDTPVKTNLLDLIDYVGVDIDELMNISQLNQTEFFSELLDLEMSGKIERQVGNKVAKIK